MGKKDINLSIDFGKLQNYLAAQFRGINPQEPGQWPLLPQVLTWLGAALLTFAVVWFVFVSEAQSQLAQVQGEEPKLQATFKIKVGQASALDELRKQKLQVLEYVNQLERQLPNKAEMDALLSDINQAGIGRGLNFELFKPGQVKVNDYYAELPISIRISGTYHDMGAFVSDIANLSRIVTLHDLNLALAGAKDGKQLTMDAVARTYRYLDPEEIEAQKKAKAAASKGAKP